MRPAPGTRPAQLMLAGTGPDVLLDTLSPNTEGLLQSLGAGDWSDLASGAWLLSPGKGATPRGLPDAQPSLLPARGALRCIDGTHTSACTACTAPPDEGDEANYELTGEVGKKNGEKRCAQRADQAGGRRTPKGKGHVVGGGLAVPQAHVGTLPAGVTLGAGGFRRAQRGRAVHAVGRGEPRRPGEASGSDGHLPSADIP